MHETRRRSISSDSSRSSVTSLASSDRQSLSVALLSASDNLSAALALASAAQREVDRLTSLLEALDPPSSEPTPSPQLSFPFYHPLYLEARNLSSDHPVFPTGYLRLGDFVQIAWPKRSQQSHGIVASVQGPFLSVRTPNGQRVRRHEANLIFVSRGASPPYPPSLTSNAVGRL